MKNFSLNSFSLNGKVALVTGGASGIGFAYSVALAKAGADVVVATIDSNVDEIKKIVEELGQRFEYIISDISKKEDRDKIIPFVVEKFGKIDILVNNAGTIHRDPLLEHNYSDYAKIIEINQNSIFDLSQQAAIQMEKQPKTGNSSGKIINIASMLSFQGGKFVPGYTASKHAVAGLTKAFANELANKNIQINAIAPGYIESANTAPIRADEARNKSILDRIPAERWGLPEDLMGTVVFLASDASNYVNGHILCVDGGWLVR